MNLAHARRNDGWHAQWRKRCSGCSLVYEQWCPSAGEEPFRLPLELRVKFQSHMEKQTHYEGEDPLRRVVCLHCTAEYTSSCQKACQAEERRKGVSA